MERRVGPDRHPHQWLISPRRLALNHRKTACRPSQKARLGHILAHTENPAHDLVEFDDAPGPNLAEASAKLAPQPRPVAVRQSQTRAYRSRSGGAAPASAGVVR